MATRTDTPADLQYYLYVDGDWRGPFHVAQIRDLLKQRQVDLDTYAYEPQRQEQLTVRLLLKPGSSTRLTAIPAALSGEESRQQEKLALALHALDEIRQASTTLSSLQGEPREAECKRIGRARDMVTEAIERHLDRPADLREIALKLQSVANDLAKSGDDRTLTVRVINMSDRVGAADSAGIATTAAAVLDRLVERAAAADDEHPFAAWEANEPPTETVVATARHELKHLQSDLNAVKEAYEKLQETHAKEQQQARKLLALAKEQIEAEQKGREGDVAELRALAGEIHSLAVSLGLAEIDAELATQIERLAKELEHAVPTAITPVAEQVLNDLVGRLDLERRDLRQQLGELAQLRADLLQSKSEMSMLRQREEALVADKAKLHKQLDEARGATVRLDQHAKAREHQLKGTIAALQVTKDLHEEFMGELQEQLKGAQGKVEEMERELTTVRRELKGTRTTHEQREQELQAALTSLSEERLKLERRRTSLQLSLQSAETELQQVKARGEEGEDDSLTEALAAKVNQLRAQFEQTKLRLREQEGSAGKLQEELAAARDEAEQLRLRSDGLSSELESARSNLDGARKRMEELHRAHARLEAEREALSKELTERKSTDSIHKPDDKSREERSHLQRVVEQLEVRAAETALRTDALAGELDHERARASGLDDARRTAQSRVDDLTAERDRLLGATVDQRADPRIADLEARLAAAEGRLAEVQTSALERSTAGHDAGDLRTQLEAERATAAALRAELDAARADARRRGDGERTPSLQRRLDDTEHALAEAAQQRTDIQARLVQALGERDRLTTELARLKSQHEAATVEHRAALAMARQAQSESQARGSDLGAEVERLRSERDAARAEAERSAGALGASSADHSVLKVQHQAQLAAANERLSQQAERAERLARELDEQRRQAAAAAARSDALQTEVIAATAERERLAADLRRHADDASAQLSDAGGERQRVADAAERLRHQLTSEQTHAADLERRLGVSRDEARAVLARHAEIAEAYASAVAATDRATADLADERRRHAVATVEAERRLADERQHQRTLETRLTDADAALTALTARLNGTERTLSEVGAERDRLGLLLTDAQREHGAQDSELTSIHRRLADEQAHHAQVQGELAALRREVSAAHEHRDGVASELADTSARHSRLQLDVDRLAREVARVTAEREAARLDNASAIAAVQRQLETEHQRMGDLSQRLSAAEGERDAAVERGRLLETRLAQSDAERERLLVDSARLREELTSEGRRAAAAAEATAAARRREIEQIAAIERLQREATANAAEREHLAGELERLRTEIQAADAQEISALDRLTARLEAETVRARSLEVAREQLRQQAAGAGADRDQARAALAEATVQRDRLANELTRVASDLAELRADATGQQQRDALAHTHEQLAAERGRSQALEHELALARGQAQIAQAQRDGLETALARSISEREKLVADLASMRGELDELRRKLRDTNPDQSLEMATLKRALASEQERVRELEIRLTQAYRDQGAANVGNDEVMRRRLDRASTRIQRLKARLARERRKTGTATLERGAAQILPTSGELSSGLRPAVASTIEGITALHHRDRQREDEHGADPVAPGRHPLTRSHGVVGGFTSVIGRPAVTMGPTAAPAAVGQPTAALVTRAVKRRRANLLGWTTRIAVLVVVASLVLWLLVLPSLFPFSGQATVVAQVARIEAPISGMLFLAPTATIGGDVAANAVLGHIDNPHVDTNAVDALAARIVSREARHAESEQQLASRSAQRDTLRAELDRTRIAQHRDLTERIAEVRLQLDLRRQAAAPTEAGTLSIDAARKDQALAERIVQEEQATIARLQRRLDDVLAGIGLGPEAEARQQVLAEAERAVATEREQQDALSDELAAARSELQREQSALARLSRAELRTQAPGRIWRSLASNGRSVAVHAPLLEIADPRTIVVEAVLSEDIANSVTENERALVHLIGSKRQVGGTVTRILHPGEAGLTPMDPESIKSVRAVITLDAGAEPLGRQGAKVFFVGDEPGTVRRWLLDIYSRLQL